MADKSTTSASEPADQTQEDDRARQQHLANHLPCTRRPIPREIRDAYCAPYDSWENRRAVKP